jgi:hypothetical protein
MMLRCSERLLSAIGLGRMTLIGLSLAGRRWELGDGNSQRGSERKRIKYEMIVSWIAPRELCSRINWKVGWVCQSDWGIFFPRDGQSRRIRGGIDEHGSSR